MMQLEARESINQLEVCVGKVGGRVEVPAPKPSFWKQKVSMEFLRGLQGEARSNQVPEQVMNTRLNLSKLRMETTCFLQIAATGNLVLSLVI